MATVNSGLTEISYAESVTNWAGDTFNLEPDIKVQGSNSVYCAATNNGNNDQYYAASFNLTSTHIRLFVNFAYLAYFSSTNPIQVWVTDGTNTDYVVMYADNTTYGGGWVDLIVDTALFTTVTIASITQVGVRVVTSSKPRNVTNTWLDNWRYGDGLEIISTTTEAVSFQDAADIDRTNAYYILNDIDGVLFCTGELILGDEVGSSNLNLVSSNETIVFPDRKVSSTLYKLKGVADTGTTDIDITGLVCKTEGTGIAADVDFSDTDLNSLAFDGCTFLSMGNFTIALGTVDNSKFNSIGTTTLTSCDYDNCTIELGGLITINSGASFLNGVVNKSTNSTALSIAAGQVTADLTGNTFVSDGTGHAVQLSGTQNTQTITWDNILDDGAGSEWTGTAGDPATTTSTGNEALLVSVNSGQKLTINVASGASVPTVKNDGTGTVAIVSGQATLTYTVRDQETKTAIEGAAVTVFAGDVGPLPYQDSVTITQTTGTATVSHTAHGFSTGQKVQIEGANENNYNRIKTITVTGANSYTYPIDSGTSSPATGTITATAVIIDGLTNASGQISDTRSYSSDQEFTGYVAKGTGSPLYKRAPLADTVDSANGLSANVLLIKDE